MFETPKTGAIAVGIATALLGTTAAQAASVTYNFNTVRTGGIPAGDPNVTPWLTLNFDDGGSAGSVDVTFSGTNLPGGEFVSELQFNLDPTLDAGDLGVSGAANTGPGTFELPSFSFGNNNSNGIDGEKFDIDLGFATKGKDNGALRFTDGDVLSFTLSGINSLDANSFNFFSQGGNDAALNMAHIQSIPNNGGSAKITGGSGNVVPTPTAALAGLAMLGVQGFRRRRRA